MDKFYTTESITKSPRKPVIRKCLFLQITILILFSVLLLLVLNCSYFGVSSISRPPVRPKWHRQYLELIVKEFLREFSELPYRPESIEYLNISNPCWADSTRSKRQRDTNSSSDSGSKQIRCLPAFYFGGFPKCSTTDLWRRLVRHPQIVNVGKDDFGFPLKEYEFWTYMTKRRMNNYVSTFSHQDFVQKPRSIVGDGSVKTFFETEHFAVSSRRFRNVSKEMAVAVRDSRILPPHVIIQYVPEAKFIVMMREPVSRLYSHYLHLIRVFGRPEIQGSRGPMTVQELFHDSVQGGISMFSHCEALQGRDRCAYNQDIAKYSRQSFVHLQIGMYAIFIRDVLQLVPKRNVIFIRSEDYNKARKPYLNQVLQLLKVKSDWETVESLDGELFIPNLKYKIKVPFNERKSDSDRKPMFPETRELLLTFYKPFNKMLAELLNDERYLFSDVH